MKRLFLSLAFAFFSLAASAQPSEAQILKDLSGPGVLSVKLSDTGGGKVWSSTDMQYYWERGAVVYRNANIAEYPNAKLRIGGIATYTLIGTQATFKRFYVTYNEYEGIPTPSDAEILGMVKGNLEQFLGSYYYNGIVGELENLRIAEERRTEWHSPNSFSIRFACSYARKTSIYDLTRFDALYETRFYRDAITAPWKPMFISSNKEEKEVSKQSFTREELSALRSLGDLEREQAASASAAALPDIEIPAFQQERDVFLFIHRVLREGTPDQFRAMMLKMLAPSYFVEGSSVQLSPAGQTLVDENLKKAYQGKSKYGEQYCPDPAVKHVQPGMIELYNKAQKRHTRIAIGLFGGRYERGVKVGQEWKITALEVWLATTQDELDYMNSFPEGELCAPAQGSSRAQAPSAAAASAAPALPAPPPAGLSWQAQALPGAKLQASFPQAVREESSRMSDGNMRYVYTAQHSSGNYQVIAYALPLGVYLPMQKKQYVERMASSFLSRNAASVLSQRDISFEGHPGRRYSLRRGSDNPIAYEVFCTGPMVYEIVYSATAQSYGADHEETFFSSLKLVK
jgi:hypothetical protein